MYTIYILKLADSSYYTGSTRDIEQRLSHHGHKKVKSTKDKLPFELVYFENYNNRSEAQSREYQIKKWKSRRAIERLIKKI
ncbi:MAG: GIY-YIG nuclease family protein [Patescibacteria group bacterium]